jgi:hypothetical protein
MKNKIFVLIFFIALLVFAGCSSNEPDTIPAANIELPVQQAEATPEPTPEPTPAPTPEPVCEHTWTEANFQTPQIFIECGETDGDPLIPYFVQHGITPNASIGNNYQYTNATHSASHDTMGDVIVTSVERVVSDETREAKEGFEWLIINATIVFGDSNGYGERHGMSFWSAFLDYYTGAIIYPDDFAETFTVNYNGETHEGVYTINRVYTGASWVNNTWTLRREYALQIPVGYDGIVFAWFNFSNTNASDFAEMAAADTSAVDVLDGDSVIFRFQ